MQICKFASEVFEWVDFLTDVTFANSVAAWNHQCDSCGDDKCPMDDGDKSEFMVAVYTSIRSPLPIELLNFKSTDLLKMYFPLSIFYFFATLEIK